jgi:hypothetical protein
VHACVAWTPTSANTLLWLKLPLPHVGSVGRWHVSHVVENPDDACGGFFVALYWG